MSVKKAFPSPIFNKSCEAICPFLPWRNQCKCHCSVAPGTCTSLVPAQAELGGSCPPAHSSKPTARALSWWEGSCWAVPPALRLAFCRPIGWIGAVSVYNLCVVLYIYIEKKKIGSLHYCSGALGQECNEAHEQLCLLKHSFPLLGKERAYGGKACRGCLGEP